MIAKELAHQAGVRSAPEFHSLEAIDGVELCLKHLRKSLYSRASSANQRPIYIKQYEPNHPGKLDSWVSCSNAVGIRS
jgi:hypothetical protein